jgi:hypothetical protein
MTTMAGRVRRLSVRLSQPTDSNVVHMRTLRAAIGLIALALPAVLVLGENIRDAVLPGGDAVLIETSISAYFHTGMREVFVGSLCAVAVFLLCYRGYERWDVVSSNVAGAALLLVAICPTPEPSFERAAGPGTVDSVTLFSDALNPDPAYVGVVHFVAAALFFVVLALMSLFLFTRSGARVMTPRKRLRNRVYVACGVIILACIVTIGVSKLPSSDGWAAGTSIVFWCEAVAVMAFGLSWLTKAELLLADTREPAASTMGVSG